MRGLRESGQMLVVLACGCLLALLSSAVGAERPDSKEEPKHPGRITGVVLSAATGKPIAGAYVGVGDFGDAGGSNLGRFQEQGIYAHTKTDENGSFVLTNLALREHPLVVTHGEFVRHDGLIGLGPDRAEAQAEVRLVSGAQIRATVLDAAGKPVREPLIIRLEALDGHAFIPPGRQRHLSAFASPAWTERRTMGNFLFAELSEGEYSVVVMQMTPTAITYYGGIERVKVKAGETKQVQVKPADYQSRVELQVPKIPDDFPKMPALVVISRNPGLLLWDDGLVHGPEDDRLGRIMQEALVYGPASPGKVYQVNNLPPGTYSFFVGPMVVLKGVKVEVARGQEITVEVPWVRPEQVGQVGTWTLKRRLRLEAREYTAREICELLTAKTESRPEIKAAPALEDEKVTPSPGERSLWEILEAIYLEKGWILAEDGGRALILRPPPKLGKPAPRARGPADYLPRPPIALLLHEDADLRIRTIRVLARRGDRSLVDDLIRAKSVEPYTPVHLAYDRALRSLTGSRGPKGGANWKSWLVAEVVAGRLKLDYLPLDIDKLDAAGRDRLQPFAKRTGPEHFEEMAAALMGKNGGQINYGGLRYMVFNDHRPQVQQFLSSDWLTILLGNPSVKINPLACGLISLANTGPLRAQINAQVLACLHSDDPTTVANALHLLAGDEGFTTTFVVPGAEERVRELAESPVKAVALQARRAMAKINSLSGAGGAGDEDVSYEEAFLDLYQTLGGKYPCFELKGIDWRAVGEELLPRVKQVKTDEEFGLLCAELVARLEDSHAQLMPGRAQLPTVQSPRWDPGFACLIDDRERPVVYYVDKGGPAEAGGVKVGMTVLAIGGEGAGKYMERRMKEVKRYGGYSSDRYLRYHAAQWLGRQIEKGATVELKMQDVEGRAHAFKLAATLGVRYLPRRPVPIEGTSDTADLSWTSLEGKVGYIYVRRIKGDLIEQLDKAVEGLKDARGLIIDVRGNSGGGFDSRRSHRNFAPDDAEEPNRPRFKGPIALLIDARCISAGEGWASWFIAQKRARVFGEATAGASSRKTVYALRNGLFKVRYPVKAYTGYLQRPIERRGLEPDVAIRQSARDLAGGRDTVLEAAKEYLLKGD